MSRERRRFSRIWQQFDAKYRLYGELTEGWNQIQTLNLSAGGMRLKSVDLLEVGAELEVQLQVPYTSERLILRGRVMWSELQASGVVENGIEFTKITPDQQVKVDGLVKFFLKKSA